MGTDGGCLELIIVQTQGRRLPLGQPVLRIWDVLCCCCCCCNQFWCDGRSRCCCPRCCQRCFSSSGSYFCCSSYFFCGVIICVAAEGAATRLQAALQTLQQESE